MAFSGKTSTDFLKRVAQQPLDYGWIEGSDRFKELVASLYQHMTPANILQTNGATGANFLALFALIESGDHVVPCGQRISNSMICQKHLGQK